MGNYTPPVRVNDVKNPKELNIYVVVLETKVGVHRRRERQTPRETGSQ